jgi:hypothetical protein
MGIIADSLRARLEELKASDARTDQILQGLLEDNRRLREELAALRFDDEEE